MVLMLMIIALAIIGTRGMDNSKYGELQPFLPTLLTSPFTPFPEEFAHLNNWDAQPNKTISGCRNYKPSDLMKAIRQNHRKPGQFQKILTDLEKNDHDYAIQCLMYTDQKNNENTVLHEAKDEKMYAMIFQIFSQKDENKLLQAILQINWENETPLFNAIRKKNEKMVIMLLAFIENNAPEQLLNYLTHENSFRNTPLFIASRELNPIIINILIPLIWKYSSNLYCLTDQHLMHTNFAGESILLYSEDSFFMHYVIGKFFETNQIENLMKLFMKQDHHLNTILTVLIRRGDFDQVNQILQICEYINKEKLIEFVMLLDEDGKTILYNVVYQNIFHSQKDIAITVERLLNIFDEKKDFNSLSRFITICCSRYQLPLIKLIDLEYSQKLIWIYIKLMAITPEEYLRTIDGPAVRFSLKKFAKRQNFVFNEDKFSLKYSLKDMVKQYEVKNFIKVCNFVGKYKVLQITGFNRFTI